MDNIVNCTLCDKAFNETRTTIALNIAINRKTNFDVWENVSNGSMDVSEVLCEDCFDLFVESLSSAMNKGAK